MKKISLLLCVILMAFSFAACSDKNNTSSPTYEKKVEKSTEDTVLAAYDKTSKKLEENALNFGISKMIETTADNDKKTINKTSDSVTFDFNDGKYNIVYSGTVTDSKGTVTSILYCDNENLYGTHLKGTYHMLITDAAKTEMEKLSNKIKLYSPINLKAIDTSIVNTDLGGLGFVFEYDVSSVSEEFFSLFSDFIEDDLANVELSSVKMSGLIDKDGYVVNQLVTFEYTTDILVATDDLEEETSSKTKTSSADTSSANEVYKNVKRTITVETKFDFSSEIEFTVPSDIDVTKTEEYTIEAFFNLKNVLENTEQGEKDANWFVAWRHK